MSVKSSAAVAILALALVLAAGSFRKIAECKDSSQEAVMVLYQWYESGSPTKRFKLEGKRAAPFIFDLANFDKTGSRKLINNFYMTCAFYLEKEEG